MEMDKIKATDIGEVEDSCETNPETISKLAKNLIRALDKTWNETEDPFSFNDAKRSLEIAWYVTVGKDVIENEF